MPDINIGDFELEENSNGELVVKDQNDTEVVTVDPTTETTTTKATDTEEQFSDFAQNDYQSNSGLSLWANQRMQSANKIPVPEFERLGTDVNPIFTVDDIGWAVDLSILSPLTTESLSSPEANIRLYVTSHDSEGLGYFHADDPAGSWTENSGGSLLSDGYETDVFVNRDDGQLWGYQNFNNGRMDLLKSSDGVSWTRDTNEVLDSAGSQNQGHVGYPRTIQTERGYFLITNGYGYAADSRKPTLAFSPDGTSFERPIRGAFTGRTEPTGRQGNNVSNLHQITGLTPYHNGWLALYKDVTTNSGAIEIRMAFTRDGRTYDDLGTVLAADDANSQTWEDDVVSDAVPFWYEGELYAFYLGGNSAATTRYGCGIAKADFSDWRAN